MIGAQAVRETGAIALKLGFWLGILHPLRKAALAHVKRGKGAENRVLIVQLDNLGDIALALGSLRSVASAFPGKEIALLCDHGAAEVARQAIPDVIAIDRRVLRSSVRYAVREIKTIKQRGFGTIVHHTTIQRGLADYYSVIALAGADRRIGYAGEAIFNHPSSAYWYDRALVRALPRLERTYTELIPSFDETPHTKRPSHVLHHYEALIRGIGGTWEPIPHLTAQATKRPPYVVLGLGAAVGYRRWPVERFAEVAAAAKERGMGVVLIGLGAERELGTRFTKHFTDADNLIGKTSLNETLNLIAGAQAVICNETSFVHLAIALHRPVVCILGGGHAGRSSLHGYGASRWAHVDIGCTGDDWACGRHLPPGAVAPCIEAVSTDLVIRELDAALALSGSEGTFHIP